MPILHFILAVLAILVSSYLLHGVHIATLLTAIILAVVLGIINVFFKPVLALITLPINILTLGLFSLVVNALLIMLATVIVQGFSVDNFWWALAFSVVLSLVNGFFNVLTRKAG